MHAWHDLMLCPGCGADVVPNVVPADEDNPETWWHACACGMEATARTGPRPTLGNILSGVVESEVVSRDADMALLLRRAAQVWGVTDAD